MKNLMMLFVISLSACATKNSVQQKGPAPVVKNTESIKEVKPIAGNRYTTLMFESGSTNLSEASKADLQVLTQKLKHDKKPIESIKILTWADKEYPNKVERVSVLDVMLANDRSAKIKRIVEGEIKSSDIDTYNMAKRPDTWSKIVKDDDYDLKESFEAAGATSTRLNDGSLSYTKASKAIVIIDYK